MVLNIISSLKPIHLLLLLSFYITIIIIIIIYTIDASTRVVVFILYDTVTSNESVKGITVVLIIVYPFNGKCTITFVWLEYRTVHLINDYFNQFILPHI